MSHYEINKAYNEMKKAYMLRSHSLKRRPNFRLGTVLAVESRSRPSLKEALLKYLRKC